VGNEIKYQEAMRDVLQLLVERASEKSGAEAPFDQGVRMGYFEAVSALLNEIETFGIDPGEVGMAGFDPMTMLAAAKQAA
jgi:hypothetical protein